MATRLEAARYDALAYASRGTAPVTVAFDGTATDADGKGPSATYIASASALMPSG